MSRGPGHWGDYPTKRDDAEQSLEDRHGTDQQIPLVPVDSALARVFRDREGSNEEEYNLNTTPTKHHQPASGDEAIWLPTECEEETIVAKKSKTPKNKDKKKKKKRAAKAWECRS